MNLKTKIKAGNIFNNSIKIFGIKLSSKLKVNNKMERILKFNLKDLTFPDLNPKF